MNATLEDVTKKKAEQLAAEEMVRRAQEQGLSLTGPDGLLKQLTKTVLETVLTEASGQVGIDVPRDRDHSFEPQIVKKQQRRLTGVGEIILSLYAKGLTTGEVSRISRRSTALRSARRPSPGSVGADCDLQRRGVYA